MRKCARLGVGAGSSRGRGKGGRPRCLGEWRQLRAVRIARLVTRVCRGKPSSMGILKNWLFSLLWRQEVCQWQAMLMPREVPSLPLIPPLSYLPSSLKHRPNLLINPAHTLPTSPMSLGGKRPTARVRVRVKVGVALGSQPGPIRGGLGPIRGDCSCEVRNSSVRGFCTGQQGVGLRTGLRELHRSAQEYGFRVSSGASQYEA